MSWSHATVQAYAVIVTTIIITIIVEKTSRRHIKLSACVCARVRVRVYVIVIESLFNSTAVHRMRT